MKKKVVSLFLVGAMLATSMVGCKSKEKVSESGGKDSTAQTTSSSAESNFNATNYPIVKEPINLKVWLNVRDTDTLAEIDGMAGVKDLDDLTNIHAEWEPIKGSDWATKLNLMFASGEYPDVIMSMNSDVDFEEYGVTQKILLPIDDLIEQYMPIYKERAEAGETDVLAGLRASDGKMYSVGNLMAQNINTPAHYFINQTWLNALKLKTPTTLNELTEVLRAFKKGDPNGNGKADEIPYQVMLGDDVYGVKLALPMFGMPATLWGNYLYIDNDRKVQFIPYQDGFRDALEWLNVLYSEGLVDVETISQDTNMVQTKLAEGNTGFFSAWRLTQMNFSDWTEKNVVLMDPVAADGHEVVMSKTMELAKRGTYITKTNKYIPETMRWIDAQLETEMMFTLFGGEKDTGWKYNDKGLIETLDNLTANTVKQELNVNGLFFAPGKYYSSVYQMAPHRVEKIEYCKQYTDKGYLQTYSNNLLKLAPLTAAEIERCKLLETDINNAITENMAKFILDGITDASWEAFVKMFDTMGVEEYSSTYQKALDKSVSK